MNTSKIVLNSLMMKYELSKKQKKEFLKLTYKIFKHKEFQKRLTSAFAHHNDIPLGYHILEVALDTYLTCIKKDVDPRIPVTIAMLHDLYELPWQNNKESSNVKYFHKHGFRHPIEAVINSICWYPYLFKDHKESLIIIDGIIHHMYPLMVPVINSFNTNEIELKNYDKIKKIDEELLNQIIYSVNRGRLFNASLCKSKFKEGRIVSSSDKKVSLNNFTNLKGVTALITGTNKNIET